MNSLCLSLVANLRCVSLSQLQTWVLLIPAGVELVFAIVLMVAKWGAGRKYFILVAEAASFFSLALVDALSHSLNPARSSINVFKIFDIVVGAASFLPLVLYISFLFVLANLDLIPNLPLRLRTLGRYVLLVFIPLTVALDELGSFIGITYRTYKNADNRKILAVGFSNSSDQSTWTFLNSIALALLVAYQAIVFSMTFYELIRVFTLRQNDLDSREVSEGRVLKGLGWLALGVKLGAVETVLGFVGGTFGMVLARRIVRSVGRIALMFGLIKGTDKPEKFTILKGDSLDGGRPIRGLISGPRQSTFLKLSPAATAFYSEHSQNAEKKDLSGRNQQPSPRRRDRVTILYDGKSPPHLEMRFSALEVPTLDTLRNGSPPRNNRLSSILPLQAPRPAYGAVGRSKSSGGFTTSSRAKGHGSNLSVNSVNSDSLDYVREIASQFPGLPPRVTGRYRGSVLGQVQEDDDIFYRNPENPSPYQYIVPDSQSSSRGPSQTNLLSKTNSLKRKAVPRDANFSSENINPFAESRESVVISPDMDYESLDTSSSSGSRRSGHVPPPIDPSIAGPSSKMRNYVVTSNMSAILEGSELTPSGTGSSPAYGLTSPSLAGRTRTSSPTLATPDAYQDTYNQEQRNTLNEPLGTPLHSLIDARVAMAHQSDTFHFRPRLSAFGGGDGIISEKETPSGPVSWVNNPSSDTSLNNLNRQDSFAGVALSASRNASPIKSFRSVSYRRTPTPTRGSFLRDSLNVEPIIPSSLGDRHIPSDIPLSPGSSEIFTNSMLRRDSDTLGSLERSR